MYLYEHWSDVENDPTAIDLVNLLSDESTHDAFLDYIEREFVEDLEHKQIISNVVEYISGFVVCRDVCDAADLLCAACYNMLCFPNGMK
jgi:hypothetical protein